MERSVYLCQDDVCVNVDSDGGMNTCLPLGGRLKQKHTKVFEFMGTILQVLFLALHRAQGGLSGKITLISDLRLYGQIFI